MHVDHHVSLALWAVYHTSLKQDLELIKSVYFINCVRFVLTINDVGLSAQTPSKTLKVNLTGQSRNS